MNDTALLDPSFDTPEALAKVLEAHPDYRVLRRLVPRKTFGHKATGAKAKVLILDTETTGLDWRKDKIIELALLLVEVDLEAGLPIRVLEVYDELEDPGMPIPETALRVTGITDEMVSGQRLNEARIATLLEGVSLVIAHNARFDRAFVEGRLPAFAELPWACSLAEIDWSEEGRGSAKLEFLASELGLFYDAHRAEMDCHALLAVLSQPLPNSGHSGLKALLNAGQTTTYKVMATGSPFDSKDTLKARGYRWDAERKVWHTSANNAELLEAECTWLKASVYGRRAARIEIEQLTARDRFAPRSGLVQMRDL
ncbi:MAG: 3'-5' exonuclease [Aquabacterium sp.]|uniref:3'-5' exonuclease n=1 Tax=Aquabacterium sp. TaxID=1872578 RepID=UPI00271AAF7E|nr:3'-5' exonuclease [Aquabacterium sp.]MDO9003056.1 3'-5' exonuclease [Aquabacterium sp.]